MGRIEQLAEIYGRHVAMPWQQTVSGAQRVIMIVYDKELERTLIARKNEFQDRHRKGGSPLARDRHRGTFAEWMARRGVSRSVLRVSGRSAAETGSRIREVRSCKKFSKNSRGRSAVQDSVVAVFGVGSLVRLHPRLACSKIPRACHQGPPRCLLSGHVRQQQLPPFGRPRRLELSGGADHSSRHRSGYKCSSKTFFFAIPRLMA